MQHAGHLCVSAAVSAAAAHHAGDPGGSQFFFTSPNTSARGPRCRRGLVPSCSADIPVAVRHASLQDRLPTLNGSTHSVMRSPTLLLLTSSRSAPAPLPPAFPPAQHPPPIPPRCPAPQFNYLFSTSLLLIRMKRKELEYKARQVGGSCPAGPPSLAPLLAVCLPTGFAAEDHHWFKQNPHGTNAVSAYALMRILLVSNHVRPRRQSRVGSRLCRLLGMLVPPSPAAAAAARAGSRQVAKQAMPRRSDDGLH